MYLNKKPGWLREWENFTGINLIKKLFMYLPAFLRVVIKLMVMIKIELLNKIPTYLILIQYDYILFLKSNRICFFLYCCTKTANLLRLGRFGSPLQLPKLLLCPRKLFHFGEGYFYSPRKNRPKEKVATQNIFYLGRYFLK